MGPETLLSLGGGALAVRPLRGLDVLHHVLDGRDPEVADIAVAGVHLDRLAAAVGRDLGHHAARATPRGVHRGERAEHRAVPDDRDHWDREGREPGGHLLGAVGRRCGQRRVEILAHAGRTGELDGRPDPLAALALARDARPLRRKQEGSLVGVHGRDDRVEEQDAHVLHRSPVELAEHGVLLLRLLELGEVGGHLTLAALPLGGAGVDGGIGRVGGGGHCRVFPFYASAMRCRSVTGLGNRCLAPFRPCLSLLPLHSSTLGPLLQVS